MRYRPKTRSVVAVTVVWLGVAAVPATAQASLLSDLLKPVVNLLGGGGSDNSGARERAGPAARPAAAHGASAAHDPGQPRAESRPRARRSAGFGARVPGAGGPAHRSARALRAPAAPGPARHRGPVSPVSPQFLLGSHLLSPPPGKVLGGLRPTLRWRGGAARVNLYNVQIFSATGHKVVSAFPRGRSLRVPAKRPGAQGGSLPLGGSGPTREATATRSGRSPSAGSRPRHGRSWRRLAELRTASR